MNAISKEVAVKEIKDYLSDFLEVEFDVENDYPKVLKAVMSGNLSFNEEKRPVYTLIEPINKGTEFEVKELILKNRVLPSVGADLAKGIDLQKEAFRYGLVVTAHICGFASYKELDKLSKKDYQLIQELAPVFM